MSEFEESGLFHELGLESRVHDVAEVFDGSSQSVVEKDIEFALEAASAKAGGSVQRQLPIKLDSWIGQLGAIDLGLRKGDVLCGIEVKCSGSVPHLVPTGLAARIVEHRHQQDAWASVLHLRVK